MPVKPYPDHFPYGKLLVRLWEKHNMIAIPKSRRMHASWTFVSLYVHTALFNPGLHIGFVSKKEEDSYELVMRAEHIIKHIPEWRIPAVLLPRIRNGGASKKPPILVLEHGTGGETKIQGFPQGEDQLRQFTLTAILEDECAFWEDAQGSYQGAKPTTDGGGKLTMISSRSPGFFKKIVFDQLDSPDYNFPEVMPSEIKVPMTGVEVSKNPKNRFLVIDLHYSADPNKTPEWAARMKQELGEAAFNMEYEKNWETYDGKPVYRDFVKGVHSVPHKIRPKAGLPLLLGWDFGLTPACVITQLDGPQYRVIEEILGEGSIDKLAARVWSHLNLHYEQWVLGGHDMIISVADPAGFQRSQTDERTCMQFLAAAGFKNLSPGPVDWENRRSAVEHFLLGYSKAGPNLLVSETGAPILTQGFAGNYKYPDKTHEIEPLKARPLKNNASHPHDALQYIAYRAKGEQRKQKGYARGRAEGALAAPRYGFQK